MLKKIIDMIDPRKVIWVPAISWNYEEVPKKLDELGISYESYDLHDTKNGRFLGTYYKYMADPIRHAIILAMGKRGQHDPMEVK